MRFVRFGAIGVEKPGVYDANGDLCDLPRVDGTPRFGPPVTGGN